MNSFMTKTINDVIGREGRYSDDPNDHGNWYKGKLEGTMWGITAAVARAYGYDGPMKEMPRHIAFDIYEKRYFITPRFDQVAELDEKIAERLFDIGVNAGQSTGVEFLQRALNTLNRQGKDFPDMSIDGLIGPVTLSAMRSFIALRGQKGRASLLFMIAAQHSVFYMELAERRPSDEAYMYGWTINRAMHGVSV